MKLLLAIISIFVVSCEVPEHIGGYTKQKERPSKTTSTRKSTSQQTVEAVKVDPVVVQSWQQMLGCWDVIEHKGSAEKYKDGLLQVSLTEHFQYLDLEGKPVTSFQFDFSKETSKDLVFGTINNLNDSDLRQMQSDKMEYQFKGKVKVLAKDGVSYNEINLYQDMEVSKIDEQTYEIFYIEDARRLNEEFTIKRSDISVEDCQKNPLPDPNQLGPFQNPHFGK